MDIKINISKKKEKCNLKKYVLLRTITIQKSDSEKKYIFEEVLSERMYIY